MLCTKIIFTNEANENAHCISDFMHKAGIDHRLNKSVDWVEVETDDDDEEIYSVCCELSRLIQEKSIKPTLIKFLQKDYACFNSDEIKIIICNVFQRDLFAELSGRIYVYLKAFGSINPFSFYLFMCKDIAKNATFATGEEADKILSMNENRDFIDLLKCFADIAHDSPDSVEITADRSGIRITACNPKNQNSNLEFGDEADLLAELVTMNPKQIEVLGKEEFLKNDLSAVIAAVFEDRILYK